jgi:ATP-dependent RNA helicase SUPV3L1/SUV3
VPAIREKKTRSGERRDAHRSKESRRRRSREHETERRDERLPATVRSAPVANKATADPDSPFAALSALKAQLEKRTQD